MKGRKSIEKSSRFSKSEIESVTKKSKIRYNIRYQEIYKMKKLLLIFLISLSMTLAFTAPKTTAPKGTKLSAKNKLGEAYSLIPSIYNLANLDEFLSRVKSEL